MWNNETKIILDKIRLNSIKLSNTHRIIALSHKQKLNFFDIPIIIMSVISSSLGSNEYIREQEKNSITLFISMIITIMTSIKLYLNITSNLAQEITLSRDYYVLSIDIYKNLNLPMDMVPDQTQYLNETYNTYVKLIEQSTLNNKIKKDELLKIDKYDDDNSSISSNSSPKRNNIIITEYEEI